MAVVSDAYDKEPSKVKEAAKRQAKKHLKKKGKKVAKKSFKISFKVIKWIAGIFSSIFGGIITPVICIMLITVLIVNMFVQVFNVEQYSQECPELVRVFLQDNYEAFENKVNKYCHDEQFVAFVCGSEFDNGYTKLVYGGTNAFTQAELKGNYEGVQEQSADWVTYDKEKDKYSAKSVLQTIQEYIDDGVSVDNITLRDEYLQGYNEASGYLKKNGKQKDTLKFTDWINHSYYCIPYYYHWNMAKNSDYKTPTTLLGLNLDSVFENNDTSVGLPSWYEDWYNSKSYWGFMGYANTTGKQYDGTPDVKTKIFGTLSKKNYTNMTYKQYLNSGFTTFKPTSNNAGSLQGKILDDYDEGKAYFAKGVMIGYKMETQNWFLEKSFDKLWGKDQLYNYYPISEYYRYKDGYFDAGINDIYLYKWFDIKKNGKTNYEKYLKNPKEISKLGKRENAVNTNIETWINNFAEYFAKEIYYTYPNRDYIVDYFLSENADETKKVAFLQRSFYAMATGSELDTSIDEEYTVEAGNIGSSLAESSCGKLNIDKASISKVKMYQYSDSEGQVSKVSNLNDIKKLKDSAIVIINNRNADENIAEEDKCKSFTYTITYNATIHLTYTDGTKDRYFKVPIEVDSTSDLEGNDEINPSIRFNTSNYDTTKGTKWFVKEKVVTFSWNQSYYDSQVTYDDEGRVKNDNPLDTINTNLGKGYKLDGYKNKSWELNEISNLKTNTVQNVLNAYCKKEKSNPILNLFNGTITGERSINVTYSDHSFLNYEVNEKKNSDGKITGVNIEIYTYYPDVSQYGDTEYRIAYGFENGDALQEAYNLLTYTQQHKGDTGELTDLNEHVNWSSLIIGLDDGSYADGGAIFSGDDLYQFIADIIFKVESSGNWGSIARPYNVTAKETTITVGAYQFFGERGHDLLKNIIKADNKTAKSILGDNSALYKACKSSANWETTGYAPASDDEYNKLSKLLKSDVGIQCQKEMMFSSIKAYIEIGQGYNVVDVRSKAFFCVMYHQYPSAAKAVAASISGDVTLEKIYKACLQNGVFGNYKSRYKTTYEECLKMTYMTGSSTEVTKILKYVQSNKVKGKPYSSKRSDMSSATRYKATYDCSELTYLAYYYGAGKKISEGNMVNTNCVKQMDWCKKNGTSVCDKKLDSSALSEGDLIFYKTKDSKYKTNHVAIYAGNGKVVDVKKGKNEKVKLRKLNNWDTKNFVSAYRIVEVEANSVSSINELTKVPQNQRLAYLFPDGIPTTEQQASSYMTTITVPIYTTKGTESTMKITVHKKLVNAYKQAFTGMCNIKFKIDTSQTAAYCWRTMASDHSKMSYHSYGSCIDINWKSNPATYTGGSYKPGSDPLSITSKVVNIWKTAGFYWGGDWSGYYRDYMHFTYTNN